MSMEFPLSGVAGIVANDADEVSGACAAGLSAVEIRADLLLRAGMSPARLMKTVASAAARDLDCLFTVRHPSHGGVFDGSEPERVALSREALDAGAKVVDAEWGSDAARELLAGGAPLILSHHDFDAMLDPAGLDALTREMSAAEPLALKIVPTAGRIADSVRMLHWVQARPAQGPHRIGFAMGAAGECSRVLTIAHGSPITYASFGDAVAPGQVALDELLQIYRAHRLDTDTRVFGIVGASCRSSFSPFLHNPGFAARDINAVYVLLQTDDFQDVMQNLDALRLDGLSVTLPYKEAALRIADEVDDRSRRCGAANTLVVRRDGGGRRIHAFNTDYDGVQVPLAQRGSLAGAKVAVLGNGGAARGAVDALREGGAVPTLFYRSAGRGAPVAAELEVDGALLSRIDDGFDVYLNATPLGTHAGDPSPVPPEVFSRPSQIAFDMVYQTPRTRFLADAERAGARCIPGSEMLVAQGIVQFRHFTGMEPDLAEFQQNFERGRAMRDGAAAAEEGG
jgi:3-dehydroquinate dehydratase/shikimate dehydrogenase